MCLTSPIKKSNPTFFSRPYPSSDVSLIFLGVLGILKICSALELAAFGFKENLASMCDLLSSWGSIFFLGVESSDGEEIHATSCVINLQMRWNMSPSWHHTLQYLLSCWATWRSWNYCMIRGTAERWIPLFCAHFEIVVSWFGVIIYSTPLALKSTWNSFLRGMLFFPVTQVQK